MACTSLHSSGDNNSSSQPLSHIRLFLLLPPPPLSISRSTLTSPLQLWFTPLLWYFSRWIPRCGPFHGQHRGYDWLPAVPRTQVLLDVCHTPHLHGEGHRDQSLPRFCVFSSFLSFFLSYLSSLWGWSMTGRGECVDDSRLGSICQVIISMRQHMLHLRKSHQSVHSHAHTHAPARAQTHAHAHTHTE